MGERKLHQGAYGCFQKPIPRKAGEVYMDELPFESFEDAFSPDRRNAPEPTVELWAKTDRAALMRAHAVAEERLDRAIKSKDRKLIEEATAFCEAFKVSTARSLEKAKKRIQEWQDEKQKRLDEEEDRRLKQKQRFKTMEESRLAQIQLRQELEERREQRILGKNAGKAGSPKPDPRGGSPRPSSGSPGPVAPGSPVH